MKQFTKTGRMTLQLGGSKDNAAIGKRLENGQPVLHAEFFTANVSETADDGIRHVYEFGIDTQLAEVLANSNSYNQYEVVLEPRFVKRSDGSIVEDIYDVPGKAVKRHRCSLQDYRVVSEKPMPANWKWVACLDDAKPSKAAAESNVEEPPTGSI